MSGIFLSLLSGRRKQTSDIFSLLYTNLNQQLKKGHKVKFRKSRASLVAQLVKNLPAIQEIPVRFLGLEDPLEKGSATHSSILGLPLWLSR